MRSLKENGNAHRWTTEEFQVLIGMWLRGASMDEMCARFGIALTGLNKVVQRLRKNGIPLPLRKNGHKAARRNKPWTQEEVETVVRMRNERASTTEIATALHRTFHGVQGMILKLRTEEDIPVVSLGEGRRRLWDADRLRAAIAGRNLLELVHDADAERKAA